MKWTFVTFDQDVVPHVLHPQVVSARVKDIARRYGASVISRSFQDKPIFDLGGVLTIPAPPTVSVRLGADRLFTCWQHQLSYVLAELDEARPERIGGRAYCRLGSFPGVIWLISAADRRKLIVGLREQLDTSVEDDYEDRMAATLAEANAEAEVHLGSGEPEGVWSGLDESKLN